MCKTENFIQTFILNENLENERIQLLIEVMTMKDVIFILLDAVTFFLSHYLFRWLIFIDSNYSDKKNNYNVVEIVIMDYEQLITK